MEKLASLTKENFWNALYEKYPEQMKKFCDWIDEYKKINNWDLLFRNKIPNPTDSYWGTPKYHDLPLAIQVGIFIQFTFEYHDNDYTPSFKNTWTHRINEFFEEEFKRTMDKEKQFRKHRGKQTVEEPSMEDETEGMAFI